MRMPESTEEKGPALAATAEQALEELANLARLLCESAISVVLLPDGQAVCVGAAWPEIESGASSFSRTLTSETPVVLADARRDGGGPRFYAGVQVRSAAGLALGTLTVMDPLPRSLTGQQLESLQVLGRQVAARLELEQERRKHCLCEERLKVVTEHAQVGLVIVSPEHRYLYANRTSSRIIGLAPDELIGKSVAEVAPGLYESQIRPRLERAFQGQRISYELAAEGKLYAVNYEPKPGPQGVECVTVVLMDITEQRQGDESRKRLAAIVESSDDAILAKDLQGRVTDWNEGATRLFGYQPEEIVGTPGCRLIPADRSSEEEQILGRLLNGESVQHFETRRQTRDGQEIDVSLTISPIRDSRGNIVGVSKVARDITARRQAEEAQRASREFLRNVIDSIPSFIYVTDRDHRYLLVNQAFSDYAGQPAASILGMTHHDLFPSDMAEGLNQENGALMESGQTMQVEDGIRGRHFLRTKFPLRGGDGQITGICSVITDLSERERAKQEQQALEARYRALFEYAPDGILIADSRADSMDANHSACRMLGYSREELLAMNVCDLVDPTDKDSIELALKAIDSRCGSAHEWRLRRRDGSVFHADVMMNTMPDGRLLAMLRDVTERNRINAALLTAEERMRAALQFSGVGIWDMNYRTGVLTWSETLESQYGIVPGHFDQTYEAFLERVHPDDREALKDTLRAAMKSGADFTVVNRAVWPDGSVRWLAGAGRIQLDDQGQPVRGIGISQDITERRLLEAQYQHAQKMEAIGRLAGGVAHDFNNLLTAILGFSEILLEDLDPNDPRRQDVLGIHKAGETAACLTGQLLAFSRKQIVEPRVLDLHAVIEHLRGMLERLIGRDVEIVVDLAPEPARILADHSQIEQVLMNLALNARDAMPQGGTLTLTTRVTSFEEGLSEGRCHVTVSDTGTGMPAEVQAKIFEPFFTTKECGRGTGLGLSTVHGIVTQAGGAIAVRSEVGQGTTFTVSFPACAPGSGPALKGGG